MIATLQRLCKLLLVNGDCWVYKFTFETNWVYILQKYVQFLGKELVKMVSCVKKFVCNKSGHNPLRSL